MGDVVILVDEKNSISWLAESVKSRSCLLCSLLVSISGRREVQYILKCDRKDPGHGYFLYSICTDYTIHNVRFVAKSGT